MSARTAYPSAARRRCSHRPDAVEHLDLDGRFGSPRARRMLDDLADQADIVRSEADP